MLQENLKSTIAASDADPKAYRPQLKSNNAKHIESVKLRETSQSAPVAVPRIFSTTKSGCKVQNTPVRSGFALSSCTNEAREALLNTAIHLSPFGRKLESATNWTSVLISTVPKSLHTLNGHVEVTKELLSQEKERVTMLETHSPPFLSWERFREANCKNNITPNYSLRPVERIVEAFDAVLHNQLLLRMQEQGWSDSLLRWTASFLRNRSVQVRYSERIASPEELVCGVPQGSPISSLLFLLSIVEPLTSGTSRARFSFADDIGILGSGRSVVESSAAAQREVNSLLDWASNNAIAFDTTKSEHLRRLNLVKRGTAPKALIAAVDACVAPIATFGAEAWWPEVRWVPGHSHISGNEEADTEARTAPHLLPPRLTQSFKISMAYLHQWWAKACPLRYLDVDLQMRRRKPPELSLPRRLLHGLIAARTGHGDFA
ncbi:hypothetical protein EPUL_001776 [Erysiphe pulchra]|uniref:Reverse transcriptase domain-containing protein n=1 Tax=Erysiphe pulchra TaxID=225359 RepID=A0A2S4PYD4_9PEZI|nr:hypothetical protein EPUL_001776 [Erysiphe pulchra]